MAATATTQPAEATSTPMRSTMEGDIYPYFDPAGFWDVCVPAVLAMWALGAAFKASEKRLMAGCDPQEDGEGEHGKGGRRVTHVFCTGVVARVLLLLLPWAPIGFLRTRWDWACTAPTVYETLAHLYHWKDTTAKLKCSLLGHHAVVLLVVWPLARLTETVPYPVSALSMPLYFEVGSAWSYLSYMFKSRGPRVLDALGMRKAERFTIPSLIWLCYWGQRVMRAASIWEGVVFLDEHPEFARARALQLVMIALEIHGAWRCFKHLPRLTIPPQESASSVVKSPMSNKTGAAAPASPAAVAKKQARPKLFTATWAGRSRRNSQRINVVPTAASA